MTLGMEGDPSESSLKLSEARFFGLSDSGGSSITSSPDGKEISILFEHLTIDQSIFTKNVNGTKSHYFALASTPAAAGKYIKLFFRGFSHNESGSATLKVRVAGAEQQFSLDPQGIFQITMSAVLAHEERTPVTVDLILTAGTAGANQMVSLDSIDISMDVGERGVC